MNHEQILGLGMDLVEIDRIQQSLDRFGDRFLEKIFHPSEIEYARTQYPPPPPPPPPVCFSRPPRLCPILPPRRRGLLG